MNNKKIPLRKCIACGESYPKKELIRIVVSDEEKEIDPSGRKNGRGAYLCKKEACIRLAGKKKMITEQMMSELIEVIGK